MELSLIKFKYGEEIICEHKIEQNEKVFIKNAAFMMPIENNQWHLMTWLPYTCVKDGIYVDKSDIFFITKLSDDMISYYKKWKEALEKNIRIDLDK